MNKVKQGKYLWKLGCEVKCEGGLDPKSQITPCYSIFNNLTEKDIVKIYDTETYGFICPECRVFTRIDRKLIPERVKVQAPSVCRQTSKYYKKLSDKEKEICIGMKF